MAFSEISPREVSIVLMILCALMLAVRLRPAVATTVWLGVLVVGIGNALVLNLQPYNLIHNNLVHYYLGAKYPVPYSSFYETINAALGKPQTGMRDLRHPPAVVRENANEQRGYFIDLIRGEDLEFDPLASLPALRERAQRTGALNREAQQILSDNLPASRLADFQRDVGFAASFVRGRELVLDFGFNGSPFYALVRHMDPTLYRPIGPPTAWFNLAWQSVAVIILAWLTGSALGLSLQHRLATAALVFASWDFVSYAFPGLVFAGLFLPIGVAVYAMRRRSAPLAGAAIAWAGLIKLFPFILLFPAVVGVGRSGVRRVQTKRTNALSKWLVQFLIWAVVAAGVLAVASTLTGRSWVGFFNKIMAQFTSTAMTGNNVSLGRGLSAFGVYESPLPMILSIASLVVLTVMFVRGNDRDVMAALPRRSLIFLAAMGWVAHNWLNYYSVGVLLLLPLLARRHPFGAAISALTMALSFTLPEFNDPTLMTNTAVLTAKLVPYILIPAWLVTLEFRAAGPPITTRRFALVACALCALATIGETWRQRTISNLIGTGRESLERGDLAHALSQYEQLARISPRNAAAYNGKAVVYVNRRDYSKARTNFERAVQLEPGDAQKRQNYGRFLFMTGHIDEAARAFEETRRLVPFDDSVLSDLARVRLRQGRRGEATELLIRALELNPTNQTIKDLLLEAQQHRP